MLWGGMEGSCLRLGRIEPLWVLDCRCEGFGVLAQVLSASLLTQVLTTVKNLHSTSNLTVGYISDAGLDLSQLNDRLQARFTLRCVQTQPSLLSSPSVSSTRSSSMVSILPYLWRGATYFRLDNMGTRRDQRRGCPSLLVCFFPLAKSQNA